MRRPASHKGNVGLLSLCDWSGKVWLNSPSRSLSSSVLVTVDKLLSLAYEQVYSFNFDAFLSDIHANWKRLKYLKYLYIKLNFNLSVVFNVNQSMFMICSTEAEVSSHVLGRPA